jgi:hypothetical protein
MERASTSPGVIAGLGIAQTVGSSNKKTISFFLRPVVAESAFERSIQTAADTASVLSPFSRRAHLDQLWIELSKDFDQICLRSHDCMDVLIDPGHFIEAGGN